MAGPADVIVKGLTSLSSRFLPFADVATEEVPLSRLMRLALFQLSVGMVQTLFVGTLNRVMILELNVPASLVAIMLAMAGALATAVDSLATAKNTSKSAQPAIQGLATVADNRPLFAMPPAARQRTPSCP